MKEKPRWPFPQHGKLSPHPNGQWCKKYRGKLLYFGSWTEPEAALKRWLEFARANESATDAPPLAHDVTVDLLVNSYLIARTADVATKRLSARQFMEYKRLGIMMIETFGRETAVVNLGPPAFRALRDKLPGGPFRQSNQIVWCKSFLRWGQAEYGVMPRLGHDFRGPQRSAGRKSIRHEILRPAEIKSVLKSAAPTVKAAILLGINGGFGEQDCALLRSDEIHGSVIRCRRNKTGVMRIVPLWPETLRAIKAARADGEFVFRTKKGHPLAHITVKHDAAGDIMSASPTGSVSLALRRLNSPWTFYRLRHTFRSVADEIGDTNAVRLVMGHAVPGVEEHYVHVMENRANKVTDYVRKWFYGKD